MMRSAGPSGLRTYRRARRRVAGRSRRAVARSRSGCVARSFAAQQYEAVAESAPPRRFRRSRPRCRARARRAPRAHAVIRAPQSAISSALRLPNFCAGPTRKQPAQWRAVFGVAARLWCSLSPSPGGQMPSTARRTPVAGCLASPRRRRPLEDLQRAHRVPPRRVPPLPATRHCRTPRPARSRD